MKVRSICAFVLLLAALSCSFTIMARADPGPLDGLIVSLPLGTIVGPNPDPWLDQGWLLNLSSYYADFDVKIQQTIPYYIRQIHLIIALNDAAYNNLDYLYLSPAMCANISIPKSSFQYGVPSPYGLTSWQDDVYPTWFNDSLVCGALIPPYQNMTVCVGFTNSTCARMHFDAYGTRQCRSIDRSEYIVGNPNCKDSTVIFFPPEKCQVTFLTNPVCSNFNITFQGSTYHNGSTAAFSYGTSGPAFANCSSGYLFDHWEATANVFVSKVTANPTNVTVKCGGTLKAVCKLIRCRVTFLTDPVCSNFNITFQGSTYHNGTTGIFDYGTYGPALADCSIGYAFDHWEVTGNVLVSDWFANPTSVTVKCGGTLKAVCKPVQCEVTFLTDPVCSNFNITFQGSTYHNWETDTFYYGTSGIASAKCAFDYVFDHWEATGNVFVSNVTANPTNVTVKCGGTLKAVCKLIRCQVTFFTDPVCSNFNITYENEVYRNGTIGNFRNGTSGPALAGFDIDYVFDHWEATGNVFVSNVTANPTNVTVKCGGTLKAVSKHIPCKVTFLTNPVSSNFNITFQGSTYHNGTTGSFNYDSTSPALANCSSGYVFDHWEPTGKVLIPSISTNPVNVTLKCGGTLKAVFRRTTCVLFTAQQHSPSVTFNASESYDADGSIVSYTWDFGDGNVTTVTEPLVAHDYVKAGTYEVTLTIVDDDGNSYSATKSLTIVMLAGDLNNDGLVNIIDVARVAKAFGLKSGEPGWDETFDMNQDGIVNIVDIARVAREFGKSV